MTGPSSGRKLSLPSSDFATLDDHDLSARIMDFLIDFVAGAANPKEAMASFVPAVQAFWATQLVEGEAEWDGLASFFANPAGAFSEDAATGYEFFGLSQHAALIREAIGLVKREQDEDALEAQLETLEERLLERLGQTSAIRLGYLRQHVDEVAGS